MPPLRFRLSHGESTKSSSVVGGFRHHGEEWMKPPRTVLEKTATAPSRRSKFSYYVMSLGISPANFWLLIFLNQLLI
jgi:hypothetical protein